eukprot:CAMPEP_0205942824 /NCGR_PEP_ID=MMETSP1325-20131115/58766_1 /ASSEMBLY_ACC=CAM_ASM_000708 /TAXON_ID=236786 /ORGANISM="Florenciella sp., Strain RCC1007" /LENGTH=99 /DNA_ID=CAMNT_0053313587 /DNA_START=9 /DNA_END=305 /DNA_ORIENTATION=-
MEEAKESEGRGEREEACVLSGGEMYELISMCHERGWTFTPDHEACAEGIDRFFLKIKASAAETEGGGDDGRADLDTFCAQRGIRLEAHGLPGDGDGRRQ